LSFRTILGKAWQITWGNKFLWLLGIPASFGRMGYLKPTTTDLISNFLSWLSISLGVKEFAASFELILHLLVLLIVVISEVTLVLIIILGNEGGRLTRESTSSRIKPLIGRAIGIYALIAITVRALNSLLFPYTNPENLALSLLILFPAIILSLLYEIAIINLVENMTDIWITLKTSWAILQSNLLKWLLLIVLFVPIAQIIFSTLIVKQLEVFLLENSFGFTALIISVSYLLYGFLEAWITALVTLAYLHLRGEPTPPPNPA
jgi:hypothetical protein